MKKFLVLTTALTCLAAPAMAQRSTDNNVALSPLTGFYMGGMGGYSLGAGDSDADGADYGVFAGYKVDALLDETINRVGLGLNGALEVHYAWSNADDVDGGVLYEKNDEFGVSFRPGLSILDQINPFAVNPYGIIGYRRTEFETTTTGASSKDHYDGFELGIGTELVAYDNVGVRFDYSHVWYEDHDNFNPREHDFRLGVAYHF